MKGNTIISGKNYMIPVNVMEGTPAGAVTWEDNIIFGGSQKGVSLGTVGSRPDYDDNTEAISAIRTIAGTTWK